jgi:hypothetical protein
MKLLKFLKTKKISEFVFLQVHTPEIVKQT